MERVYIPKARILLLARNSSMLRELERLAGCRLSLDIGEHCVDIYGEGAFSEYLSKGMVTAYGRGFDLKEASKLLIDDYYIKIIDLKDWTRNKDRIKRIKSRIIGTSGRAKARIEQESSSHISVYGETIAIIGKLDQIGEAEAAIETIIKGGSHRLAYKRLESAHRTHHKEE
jgi:arCOG04150 universal archaeal KH domain protein